MDVVGEIFGMCLEAFVDRAFGQAPDLTIECVRSLLKLDASALRLI